MGNEAANLKAPFPFGSKADDLRSCRFLPRSGGGDKEFESKSLEQSRKKGKPDRQLEATNSAERHLPNDPHEERPACKGVVVRPNPKPPV